MVQPEIKHEVRMTPQAAEALLNRLVSLEERALETNEELGRLNAEIKHIRGVLRGKGFPLDN